MNPGHNQAALKIIEDNFFLNIASITPEGKPWNTPVYFAFDSDFNFYWYSPKEAVHSKNILVNGSVFLTIYQAGETEGGLYIEANARELSTQTEVERVMTVFNRKIYSLPQKSVEDFLNTSPLRFYLATPTKIYLSSPKTASKFNGLWVDHRIQVDLKKS